MTLDEFYELLCEMDIPVVYRAFEEGNVPPLPYIVYYEDEKSVFWADNIPYFINPRVSVELYTEKKDPKLEAELERLLRGKVRGMQNPLEYYWEDDDLNEVLYEVIL